MTASPAARAQRVLAGDLELSTVHWPALEGVADAGDTLFILHGFLDLGWGMAPLAEALRRAGVGAAIYAPDWRGHGDSAWIGPGGYYHFVDYIEDLTELVLALGRGRVFLVGHSMGGAASAMYAGAFPETIAGLVNVEGLGPPAGDVSEAPDRVRAWVGAVRRARSRRQRTSGYADIAAAAERLREANPRLGKALALELAERGTRELPGGGRVWKFDPLHRTPSPFPFSLAQARSFWARIQVPVLLVEGEESPWRHLADVALRRSSFPQQRHRVVPGAGHMVHQDAPDALAELVAAFVSEVRAGTYAPDPEANR